jgi:predicted ATPase
MRPDGYFAQHSLSALARITATGHGDQVLLSQVTYELVIDRLPPGVTLLDMGEHRLKDLINPEHIFQLVIEGLPSDFPPLSTIDNRPNNLPRQTTALIGREQETAAVCSLLRKPGVALVTLTGPGGTGKTRLALQVGTVLLDDFPDGVWFVELSALSEQALVVSEIAHTLGLAEQGGRPIIDTLRDFLGEKRLLLILDNFEQVTEAAPRVGELLQAAPGVKVLVSSRTGLRISGEHEYGVAPLAVPDARHLPPLDRLARYEAVRLFVERAAAVKEGFQVTEDNAAAVAEICVRLDGLPLAIELAAARIKMLPPHALLSRLSQSLKLLTGGPRDLPARQQTLRNTIEWSYNLLSTDEQQLFRRMAPFSGGRTLEALEEVCNFDGKLQVDVFDGVQSLLDNSLLQQREGGQGGRGAEGEPRFWMLETIHEYATEKLQESGEAQDLYRAHALYFMRLVEEAEPKLRGEEQLEWLTKLDDEHDNIRAALAWSSASASREDREIGLLLGGAMSRFWEVRGHLTEGREQLAELLEATRSDTMDADGTISTSPVARAAGMPADLKRGKALVGASRLAWRQGDLDVAGRYGEEGLAASQQAGDRWGIANSLLNLGVVTRRHGEFERARTLFEESLALFREIGDKWSIGAALNNLAQVIFLKGEYGRARDLWEESLAIRRVLGDKWGMAYSLSNLGAEAFQKGDYERARALSEEALVLHGEIEDTWGIALSLNNLGNIAYMEGDYAGALSWHTQSLRTAREIGAKPTISMSLGGVGEALIGLGGAQQTGQQGQKARVEKGARLLGASDALFETIGHLREPDDQVPYDHAVEAARTALGEERLEALLGEGRKMSMEKAVAHALEAGPA